MSFEAKLSDALQKADRILLDNQEVYTWYPNVNMPGWIRLEYGEDVEFPERADVKDGLVTIDDDGQCTVKGEDPDADDIELGEDEDPPTKDFTIDLLKDRAMTEEDLK